MNFGQALETLKQGGKVARKGWNGKGMFLFIADEIGFHAKADMKAYEESGVDVHDSICMLTAKKNCVCRYRFVRISKKWTMPVRDWGLAYAQFSVYFEDRMAA